MRRPRVTALLLAAASLAGLAACTPASESKLPPTSLAAEQPDGPPSITGTITAISDGRARIEARPADEDGSPKAVVEFTGARILRRSGGTAAASDVAVGQRVSAWFTGPVLRSYPEQAVAAVVVIEREAP